MIKCAICGKEMIKLTPAHLAYKHKVTFEEYYQLYGKPEEIPEVGDHPANELLTDEEASLLSSTQKQFLLQRIQGKGKGEAMEAIGRSTSLLYTPPWVKVMPIIDAVVSRLLAEPLLAAHATILAGSEQAARTMVDLTSDPDPRIRLHASSDILDRSGISRKPKADIETESLKHMTNEELDAMISDLLAAELAKEAIETEFQVVEDEPFASRDWQNRAFKWYWYTVRKDKHLNSADEFRVMEAFKLKDIYGNDITREEAEKVLESFDVDWRQVE